MTEEEISLSYSELKPNQLVTIVVKETGYRGAYESRIEEVGESHLLLAAPISHGTLLPLSEGTDIRVDLIYMGDSCCFFSTIIRRIRYPIPMLLIDLPPTAIKLQRRSWVRVPAVLDISILLMEEADAVPVEAKTLDISGGGMMLSAHHKIKPDSELKISLSLPSGITLSLVGRVVRVIKPEEKDRPYRAGVEFIDIDNRDRDHITRFVFDRQRDLIKRGLLE